MLCKRQMFSGRLPFSLRTKNVLVQAAFQPLPFLFQMIFQILQRLLKVCGKEYIHFDAVFDTQYGCYSLFLFCSWISDWSLLAQIFATFFFFLHVLWLALSKCQCLGDLQCFLIFFLLCFLLLLCSPPTMTKKCLTLCSALAVSIAKICGSTGTECCYLFFLFFLWLISHGWEILWEH